MLEPLTFYQSKCHAWHFSTVRDDEVVKLPQGAKFQCIDAPGAGILKRWSRTQFRVGTWFDPAHKKYLRVYFAEYTKLFDDMPLHPGETVVETFGIELAIK